MAGDNDGDGQNDLVQDRAINVFLPGSDDTRNHDGVAAFDGANGITITLADSNAMTPSEPVTVGTIVHVGDVDGNEATELLVIESRDSSGLDSGVTCVLVPDTAQVANDPLAPLVVTHASGRFNDVGCGAAYQDGRDVLAILYDGVASSGVAEITPGDNGLPASITYLDPTTCVLVGDPTAGEVDYECGTTTTPIGTDPGGGCPEQAPGEFPACEPPVPGADPCDDPATPEAETGTFPDCLGLAPEDLLMGVLCAVNDNAEGILADFLECGPVTPPGPKIGVEASDKDAAEGADGNGQFSVSRSGDDGAVIEVEFAITGGATRDTDYTLKVGETVLTESKVSFPAGMTSVVIDVIVTDDTDAEGAEDIVLTLADKADYTEDPSSAAVTIAASDSAPSEPECFGADGPSADFPTCLFDALPCDPTASDFTPGDCGAPPVDCAADPSGTLCSVVALLGDCQAAPQECVPAGAPDCEETPEDDLCVLIGVLTGSIPLDDAGCISRVGPVRLCMLEGGGPITTEAGLPGWRLEVFNAYVNV